MLAREEAATLVIVALPRLDHREVLALATGRCEGSGPSHRAGIARPRGGEGGVHRERCRMMTGRRVEQHRGERVTAHEPGQGRGDERVRCVGHADHHGGGD